MLDRVRVNERSSRTVEFDIVNEDGVAVTFSSLTAGELTLFDLDTFDQTSSPADGVINSRYDQNILNTNNVTIHANTGHVTWTMQPEDNIIVTSRRQIERHRAMFKFAWSGGSFNYEIEIEVVNLRKVA